MPLHISITAPATGLTFPFTCIDGMTVEALALQVAGLLGCSDPSLVQLQLNGRTLSPSAALTDAGVQENDLISAYAMQAGAGGAGQAGGEVGTADAANVFAQLLAGAGNNGGALAAQQQQQQQQQGPGTPAYAANQRRIVESLRSAAHAGACRIEHVFDSGLTDPLLWRELMLSCPMLLNQLSHHQPEMARAIRNDDPTNLRQLMMRSQLARELEAQRVEDLHRRAAANPFDVEAQKAVEEEIRKRNIHQQYLMAQEQFPESFMRVTMLYIPMEINGKKIQAFIDSGCQRSIMSQTMAEACGLMHLLDTRFMGLAVGVGTARILGRVHIAQVKIGSTFYPFSFDVMETKGKEEGSGSSIAAASAAAAAANSGTASPKKPAAGEVDFLFGLEMLKRYRASIDLGGNCLRLQGAGGKDEAVQFLSQGELPQSKGGTIPDDEFERREKAAAAVAAGSASASASAAASAAAVAASTTAESDDVKMAANESAGSALEAAAAPAVATAPTPGTAPATNLEAKVASLVGKGYTRADAEAQLTACDGDVEMALTMLQFLKGTPGR